MQDITTFLQQHIFLTSGIIIVIFLLFIVEVWRMRKKIGGLTPTAAIQLINHQHAVVIDIRDPEIFKKGHIVNALNIQANDLMSGKKLDKWKNKPLIIVCPAGISANKPAQYLNEKGLEAYVLQGGMKAWYDSNLPIIKENNHG